MLSWTAWLRVHAAEPQWRQDVIRDIGLPTMNRERWVHLKRGDPSWKVHVIDTIWLTVAQVIDEARMSPDQLGST